MPDPEAAARRARRLEAARRQYMRRRDKLALLRIEADRLVQALDAVRRLAADVDALATDEAAPAGAASGPKVLGAWTRLYTEAGRFRRIVYDVEDRHAAGLGWGADLRAELGL